MTCNTDNRALIVVGSKVEFTIFLTDEYGRPISISPYVSGNLVFCNTKGVRTVIPLSVPGANPDKGELAIVLTSAQSSNADEKWKDADVELVDSGAEPKIIPLSNMFEIQKRNCPPIIP